MTHLIEEQSKQHHFSKFELDFIEHFNQFGMSVFEVAVRRGLWKKERRMGEAFCLIHSELSKAFEALRKENPPNSKLPDLSEVEVSLADVIIRIMDIASKKGFRVGEALIRKHHIDKTTTKTERHFEL